MNKFKSAIRIVENYPKEGVNFKDISPVIEDKKVFRKVINSFSRPYKRTKIDKVVGIESRGFLFASAIAYKLKSGLVMVRKANKLPCQKISKEYNMEYGNSVAEIHMDSIKPGEKVIIVDDVLSTGGTMEATIDLVKQLGAEIISLDFLLELVEMKGREKLKGYEIKSLIKFYGK